MPDRETNTGKRAPGNPATPRPDDHNVPQDSDVGQPNDPDAQKSTASRPRGHTEEPDSTL